MGQTVGLIPKEVIEPIIEPIIEEVIEVKEPKKSK